LFWGLEATKYILSLLPFMNGYLLWWVRICHLDFDYNNLNWNLPPILELPQSQKCRNTPREEVGKGPSPCSIFTFEKSKTK
jgi:hypothetical protein